jgi:hypothetical protein
VRDFLVTRRAKITPQQAGLTIYGGTKQGPAGYLLGCGTVQVTFGFTPT